MLEGVLEYGHFNSAPRFSHLLLHRNGRAAIPYCVQ
jgi:hypothetical protein